MKVGDYVRLDRCQGINKIVDFENGLYVLDDVYYDEWGDQTFYLDKKDVLQASSNIIDLIDVGDYVNGWKITTIDKKNNKLYVEDEDGYLIKVISRKNIKSVVTSGSFTTMEFIVHE